MKISYNTWALLQLLRLGSRLHARRDDQAASPSLGYDGIEIGAAARMPTQPTSAPTAARRSATCSRSTASRCRACCPRRRAVPATILRRLYIEERARYRRRTTRSWRSSTPSGAARPLIYLPGWIIFGTTRRQAWAVESRGPDRSRRRDRPHRRDPRDRADLVRHEPVRCRADDAIELMQDVGPPQRQADVRHLPRPLQPRGHQRLRLQDGRGPQAHPHLRRTTAAARSRASATSVADRRPDGHRVTTATSPWRSGSTVAASNPTRMRREARSEYSRGRLVERKLARARSERQRSVHGEFRIRPD